MIKMTCGFCGEEMKMEHGAIHECETEFKADFKNESPSLLDDLIACAKRYRWLRNEYANGRETYLAEYLFTSQDLDDYIDNKIKKENEKC
jgi:hypothetical protein